MISSSLKLSSSLPALKSSKRFIEYLIGEALWLSDIKREQLIHICKRLGNKEYLGNAIEVPTFPVQGLIFTNENGRRCVCLIVEFNGKKVHVPFVINSGSPRTTLGEETVRALGIKESAEIPDQMIVAIHGIEDCSVSHVADHKRLKDINILGWNFMKNTGVYEFANPAEMKVTLYRTMTNFFDAVKEGKVK